MGVETPPLNPVMFLRMSAIFCSLMEVDRISGNSTVVESEQLQKNYKGSIRLLFYPRAIRAWCRSGVSDPHVFEPQRLGLQKHLTSNAWEPGN